MSCMNSTSPININNESSGTCDLKCNYRFKYNDSTTTIKNKGNYLSLTYEKPNIDPVVYNSTSYYVEEIRVYTPSLHESFGSKTDAELIIIHTSDYNGKLLVCIPISSTKTDTSPLLETIILTSSQFADTLNKKTFLTKSINLNSLIPSKKMYIYKGTLPFSPCNGEHTIIAFSKKDDAYIPISNNNLEVLNKLIKKNSIKSKKNTFYTNTKGPTNLLANSSDEIYIDCNPISDDGKIIDDDKIIGDGEKVMITPLTDFISNFNYKKIINSIFFQIFISLIVTLIIYKLFNFIIDKNRIDEVYNASSTFEKIKKFGKSRFVNMPKRATSKM
jgi:carbonic anhydrase